VRESSKEESKMKIGDVVEHKAIGDIYLFRIDQIVRQWFYVQCISTGKYYKYNKNWFIKAK
jgi:hypothetical protein